MSDPDNGADTQEVEINSDGPHVQVHAQYVKDLSFENPAAPDSFANQKDPPNIEVSVDVGARSTRDSQFEVELRITAKAANSDITVFVVEVLYAGIFTLHNVAQEKLKGICLIECPRLLFPFARRIVADATRDGGFPPLLLEPIDFSSLYLQSTENSKTAATNGNGIE